MPAARPSLRVRVFGALLVAAGCVVPSELQGSRVEEEEPTGSPPRAFLVPDEARPPSPEAQLEARLAAFAAAVEDHRASLDLARPPVDFDVAGLDVAIRKLVGRFADEAMVSVHVRDLGSDQIIFDYYGDTPLNPASNLKLVTASAALDLLGPEYTFKTEVRQRGEDLVVVGAGDPSLTSEALGTIAEAVAERVEIGGLRRIVVDDQVFSPRRIGPGYDDAGPGFSYEATSGALSLDFNTVEVTVFPVKGARRPGVRVSPPSSHVVVENLATQGGASTRITVETRPRGDATVVSVTGRIPSRGRSLTIRRRIYDPALFTGGALAVRLAELSGTEVLPVIAGAASEDDEVVVIHESPPLVDIADDLLAYSNNFMAEQLLRTLGWRMSGAPGDWDNGVEVLRGYWSAVSGEEGATLVAVNGSGLSEVGRVTTSGLVDLIAMAQRSQEEGAGLVDILPVAGERGTMRARLRLSGKRVRAKTGTLDGVSGLSGVITAEDGSPSLAFSILINVRDGATLKAAGRRKIEDRVVMTVLRALDDFEARRGFLAFEPLWVHGGEGAEADEAADEPAPAGVRKAGAALGEAGAGGPAAAETAAPGADVGAEAAAGAEDAASPAFEAAVENAAP